MSEVGRVPISKLAYLDVPDRKWSDQRWSDQWVISPQYTPFISRWNNPLILAIDPNFQRDILVNIKKKSDHPGVYEQASILGGEKIQGPGSSPKPRGKPLVGKKFMKDREVTSSGL